MSAHTVYTFLATDGTVLYVGCTSDPMRRFEQHRLDKEWYRQVATIECEHHDERAEALRRENELVKALDPIYTPGGRIVALTGWPECTYSRHCGQPAVWGYSSRMSRLGRDDGRADRLVCDYHLNTRLSKPGVGVRDFWRLDGAEDMEVPA